MFRQTEHQEVVLVAGNGVGQVIRTARVARGLSLRGLAGRLGVSPATLSAVENGRTAVTVERVTRIAALLDVPVADLVAPGGERRPAPRQVAPGGPPPVGDWRAFGPLRLDPALDAALATFVDLGYHGSTIRRIAARAGLSVSGLYHYYPGKYHMLVALLDLTMADLDARMRAARALKGTPVERVAALVECLALFHAHRRQTAFLGASEMRSLRPADHARVAAVRRAQQQALDDEVAAAVAAGELTVATPGAAARAVVTLCTAIPQWYRAGGPTPPEELARQYVGFALALLGRAGVPPEPPA